MFVDSHCHLDRLDLSPFSGDFRHFLDQAAAAGVDRMLCVSINLTDYPSMRTLVRGQAGIDVSVGVHPNETCAMEPTVAELIELARDPEVVALGETGLDYFRDRCDVEVQEERFRRHIRAAIAVGKPLIVHSRNAREDTVRVLREERAGAVGGVFHCFTEDWAIAQQALALNFLISFSGVVTFKNAASLHQVAREVPADGYLIETDSPYLAPMPMRGKPNYPHFVRYVAEALARLRDTDVAAIARQSSANYHRLFRSGS